MISVLTQKQNHPVVREFFELFKTPWQFHENDCHSDVLICVNTDIPPTDAKLVLVYGGEPNSFDSQNEIPVRSQLSKTVFSYEGARIPIYGNALTFAANLTQQPLIYEDSSKSAMFEITNRNQTIVRIGYDLFFEIEQLLTIGQPVAFSDSPALELHITLLRDLIISNSIPLIEIPPLPDGYKFIACLTHDMDHVGIRNHKFDHTMFGFLYRATIGTFIHFFTGKKSLRDLAKNWKAAISLPWVHFGSVDDFWSTFGEYAKIENGLSSTFFVIPEKNNPGKDSNGNYQSKRAASYDIENIANELKKLQLAGHEIGVHGIDAWRDSSAGRHELRRVAGLTGASEVGIRMHWLFFDEQSPRILEEAGFSYDSTVGYNETIGYRAGCSQVFKPLQTDELLELPMHIMDTALFYPSYLNFSFYEAENAIKPLIQNAIQFGGVLTINWHDRSIAPERLWGDFYRHLLTQLREKDAWIANAGQVVSWFRKRRSVNFNHILSEDNDPMISFPPDFDDGLPGLQVRIFNPNEYNSVARFVDVPLDSYQQTRLAA